jgi:hypothetical protein
MFLWKLIYLWILRKCILKYASHILVMQEPVTVFCWKHGMFVRLNKSRSVTWLRPSIQTPITWHSAFTAESKFVCGIFAVWGSTVAQWLRYCATNQKVAGSIPNCVIGIFHWHKSFWSHYGPGVGSASNRNEYQEYFLGVNAAGA